MTGAPNTRRAWLRLLAAPFIWLAFALTVLSVAYVSFWTLYPEVALCGCACFGVTAWLLTDKPRGALLRRVACGVLGAILGAVGAVVLDYVAFPASGRYGIELVAAGATASAMGCCVGMLAERRWSGVPVPKWAEVKKQLAFIAGTGLFGSVACVFMGFVPFLMLGVPGVCVGMGGMELHFRLKANVPALQQWAGTQAPNAGTVPEEQWPEAMRELKPTGAEVKQGRLYLRFDYGRVHDYTIIVRPESQCRHWYDRVGSAYVEH
ncbi:MAG: hypothetical protein NTW87_09315 [Planctomycetota bacterium]|nr:hypothetical protein [Planctomycetota bacterium]